MDTARRTPPIQDILREFILSSYTAKIAGVTTLEDGENFIEVQILDSLTLLGLVTFIEGEFGVEIPAEDVIPDKFSSIALICTYLDEQFGVC
jgi:acyl carrier protein